MELFTPGEAAALLQLLEQDCLEFGPILLVPCQRILESAICGPLPPGGLTHIEALLRCTDCRPPCVATGQPPAIFCPGEIGCDQKAMDACAALQQTLRAAAICHIGTKLDDDPSAPISRPELDRALGAAACAFLKAANGERCESTEPPAGTPRGMSCLALVKCLGAIDSPFRQHLTGDFFCALFSSGCSECYEELCALDGKGSPEDCDLDGNGTVDCDDLKLLIEIKKGCACADAQGGGGAPGDPTPGVLSSEEIVSLACAFFGPEGCAASSGGGFDDCREMAECLVTIEDFPPDAICLILNGACEPPNPPCDNDLCAILGPNPPDLCALLGGRLPTTALELQAILEVIRCCPGAPALSDKDWASIICKLLSCGDSIECEEVADALLLAFGPERGERILAAAAKECEAAGQDCTFEDAIRRRGRRERGGCPEVSSKPVDLSSGEKLESVVDLTVALPGGDFTIERSYSSEMSDALSDAASLVGHGWSLSTFQFIERAEDESAPFDFYLHSESSNARHGFGTDDMMHLVSGRPDRKEVRRVVGSVPISDTEDARAWLWQLEIPGGGTRHYVDGVVAASADPAGIGTLPEFADAVEARSGLLVRETTAHGRRSEYVYVDYGSPAIRPSVVYLGLFGDDARVDAPARVVFSWYFTSGAERGNLRNISVFRGPIDEGVLTQSVDYLYLSADVPTSTASRSSDLGRAGDLIQVTARQLTDSVGSDGAPLYHSRVTQYRYHQADRVPAAGEPNSSVDTVVGDDHQLKLVIKPEQVEYFAQRRLVDTPFNGSVDGAEIAGFLLLGLDDDDDAFTDVGSVPRKLSDLAEKVVGYGEPDASTPPLRRVAVQFLQASCGCAGSAQGVKLEFDYLAAGPAAVRRSTVVRECTQLDAGGYAETPFRVTRHDLTRIKETPYLVSRAVSASVDPATGDGVAWWVSAHRFDPNGRRTHTFMPSSIASYVPATDTTPASFTVNATGLVERFVYGGEAHDGRVLERRVGSGDSDSAASYTLVERTSYLPELARSYLPTKVERFRWAGSSAADDVETTTYAYGFRGGADSADLAWVSTTTETELVSENGTGGNATSFQLIDPRGQTVATRSADGVVSQWTYSLGTGAVTSHKANAGTLGLDGTDYPGLAGWTWSAQSTIPGGAIHTGYEHDLLGRVTAIRRADFIGDPVPGAIPPVTTRTRRELRPSPERPGILYYAEVSLPHKLVDGTVSGPATVTLMNAGGGVIRSSDWTVSLDGSSYALGTEVARSVVDHAVTGVVTETRRWSSVAGNRYDTTEVRYDAIGRIKEKVSPNGSVERYTYDLLDRVIAIRAGQDGDADDALKLIAEYFYDSVGTATQGIGDGNVTLVRQYDGEGSAWRDSVRVYDRRNRLVQVWGPTSGSLDQAIGPHEVRAYDNLDRLVERGLFSQLPTPTQGGNQDALIAASGTDRLLYSRISYSQRGLPFRTAIATAPASLSLVNDIAARNKAAFSSLVKNQSYDASARVVAATSPGAPATKRAYDAHGRVVKSFVTDRGGPTVVGGSNGDFVVEQTNFTYDDRDRLSLVATLRRRHDDTTTRGPLDAVPSAIRTFVGSIYDTADRIVKTVNLGTNIAPSSSDPLSEVLRAGGTEPAAWPPAAIPSWAIVEEVSYDARGAAFRRTDPLGRRTLTKFDDLGRQVATVE